MATEIEIKQIAVCRFCGQKMMTVKSINHGANISRLRMCKNPDCGKEVYVTREIHPNRFAFLEKCEQQQWAKIAAETKNSSSVVEPRSPEQEAAFKVQLDDMMQKLTSHLPESPTTPPVIEHSYERALTPVDPSPTTPNWKFPDWGDYADRHEPAQRAHYEAAVQNWNTEHPHLARSPAPWVEQPVEESSKMTDAEAALARDVAQNKAYYALKAELDRRLRAGEIDTDQYDTYLRELS